MKPSPAMKTLLALLALLAGFGVLACNDRTTASTAANGAIVPGLSDPDAVFFHNASGSVTVTYGDLYEEFKVNDGINQLLFMVDSILLEEELAAVTDAEIEAKRKYLTYGTSDDAEIAEIDAERRTEYETTYAQNMTLLGYAGREADYIAMVVAKENYTAALLRDEANADEYWYVSEEDVATAYTSGWFEDVQAIRIKFLSLTDAEAVLRHFNLVSYRGELRRYTGTRPIDTVSSASFTDENTAVLSDAEILVEYIRMYNFVYGGYRDPIAEDATLAELVALPELNFVYDEVKSAQTNLAAFLFATLGSYEAGLTDTAEPASHTYAPVKYYGTADTAYYMILKLAEGEKVDLADFDADDDDLATLIGADVYAELEEALVRKQLLVSSFIANRIADLRAEHGFTIKDYYLGVDYQSIDSDYELDEEGDASVVAVIGEETITADAFLAFALAKNGGLYALYAAQFPYVFDSHFADVYCTAGAACETDLSKNESEKLAEHEETLETLRTGFEGSSYAATYTFAEYLYLAYGAKSEAEMLEKYYIKSTLQPYAVYDRIIADDWALLEDYLFGLVQDYYDNYFSLDVQVLQIFVDRDEDGLADDYAEFTDALEDPVAYATLLDGFEAAIRTYLAEDDTLTFANLISTYNKAKRDDPVWGDYKAFGLMLGTADLKTVTYLSTADSFDQNMVDGFVAAYAAYALPENEDADYLYYDELVDGVDGAYLLYCEKGTDFTRPSAQFTMTYEDDGVTPKYTPGIENAGDMPTLAQLKIYATYRFYEIVYGTGDDVEETYGIDLPEIPASVTTAIEAYFTDLHDSMYVVGFLNIIVAEQIAAGAFEGTIDAFTADDAALKALVATISDVYFVQVFDAYDVEE